MRNQITLTLDNPEAPPMILLGVNRLAIRGLMFEIEATAAD